ncbi:MAG: acetyl-CoA carboxylase carboxyltransferase subunit alpha [Deltaproteobacteria bacterium]|nr:acetyl-CoA carboxylase carboxyltransferase subunit alpha [Deltaproteobacteria bacterium]
MVLQQYLDFEKPIVELEKKVDELKQFSDANLADEIESLEKKIEKLTTSVFSKLSPWQIAQIARHPHRPYTLDHIANIFEDFIELHGDRNFRDDPAIAGGFAKLDDETIMVIGHQKGRTTKEKILRNFGMPNPEGFRKALRLMSMAERFGKPIITFIDTPGAFPGIGAEERGQAEAIAKNLMIMSKLKVPIITVVIGEGGSGGALAIGVGDRVIMLEYSVYSVISPEGCAAILWKDGTKAEVAASSMRLTSKDLLELKVIDEIVKEPLGGAHRDPEEMAKTLKNVLKKNLMELNAMPKEKRHEDRYKKYRNMGVFLEAVK